MARKPYSMTRIGIPYPFTGYNAGVNTGFMAGGLSIDHPLPPTKDFGDEDAFVRWACAMACARAHPAPKKSRKS
jgi:hypothetical protein